MSNEPTDAIMSIKLTKEGKIPIKDSEIIQQGKRADSLADSVRATIIHILRRGIEDSITSESFDEKSGTKTIVQQKVQRHIMSVAEIVRLSKVKDANIHSLTKSQVYHHLPELIEYGYIIKYGIVTKGKRVTEFYRRTSKIFIFESSPGYTKKQMREWTVKTIDQIIERFGFSVTEAERNELIELQLSVKEIQNEAHSRIQRRATGDVASKELQDLTFNLLLIYIAGSEEWIQLNKRMHNILFSKDI